MRTARRLRSPVCGRCAFHASVVTAGIISVDCFLIFRYHRGGDLPSRPPLSILSFPSPPFRVSLFCVSVLRPSSPLCVNPTRGRETSDGSSSWHRVCFLLFLSFLSSDVCGEGAKIGALPSQVFRLGVDRPHGVGVYG